jgi:hypothetical protein
MDDAAGAGAGGTVARLLRPVVILR